MEGGMLTDMLVSGSDKIYNLISICINNDSDFNCHISELFLFDVLFLSCSNSSEMAQVHLSANNTLLSVLAALGLCFAFFDVVILLRARMSAKTILYHEWLYVCSEFLVWVSLHIFLSAQVLGKHSFLFVFWEWYSEFSVSTFRWLLWSCQDVKLGWMSYAAAFCVFGGL